jgi:pyruvate formate lyase activating enzyme
MEIGGLQKTTLIDFPGRIAATIFLCGCNFRCPWCYSSELVLPERIRKQPKITEKEFFKFLKSRKELLEGVVVCGGEPMVNKDLPDFVKKIKKLGFLVKLDTNGSNPQMLKNLIDKKLIDYVAMDIKGPKEEYSQFTGVKVDTRKIQKSIDILRKDEVDYEFRSTMVPSLHTKEDVIEMAKWISGAKRYYLQNFRSEKTIDPKFEKIKPYPQEFLLEIQKIISPFFETCQVR